MANDVHIPTSLRGVTRGEVNVTLDGSTLKELIDNLDAEFPGMASRLVGEDGELGPFVTIILADSGRCSERSLATPVPPSQAVWIVPAFAGE